MCQISRLLAQKYGKQPPKSSKFRIFAINLPIRSHSFAQFLRNSQILYASVSSFYVFNVVTFGGQTTSYKHFSAVGAFSLKFSIAHSGDNYWSDQKKLGDAKMMRSSSITVPSVVGIVGRAAAVDEKVWCFLPAGLREAQPCRYCFYSVVSKNRFFAPQGLHVTPINVKFGTVEQLPFAKFHVYRGRNVGIQPPKLSKFWILAISLLLRGHSFAQFLRNSQILYTSIGSFYVFNVVTFWGQATKL